MKKIIIVTGLILCSFGAKAQVLVDGTNVNDLDVKYIEMIGQTKLLNPTKVKIFLDFGQDFSFKQQTIKTAAGKTAAFNSVVDALNFLDANGWEYVNNYIIQDNSNGELTYKYLLKKKDK